MATTEKSSIGEQNESSIEQVTRAEESKGEQTDSEEESKQVARAMLIEGIAIADIVKETGLKTRTIWSLKGALARIGNIPTRNELEKQAITEEGGGGTRPIDRRYRWIRWG